MSEFTKKAIIDFLVEHVNIYGDPSSEIIKTLKGFNLRVYYFSQGLKVKAQI